MRHIRLYEDYIRYGGGETMSTRNKMPFVQQDDPDELTTGIMGKGHTLTSDDLQFDPEKVLEVIRKDPFAGMVASQVMSANAPDFQGALGDEQIDGLRRIFDEVINRTYRLRQMYKGLPDASNESEEIKWDGRHLTMGDSMTSIPGSSEDSAVIFDNGESTATVYRDVVGIYGNFGSYDKRFKDEKELVDYLNKEKFKYIGIDDRN